jgi:hypothetical protein
VAGGRGWRRRGRHRGRRWRGGRAPREKGARAGCPCPWGRNGVRQRRRMNRRGPCPGSPGGEVREKKGRGADLSRGLFRARSRDGCRGTASRTCSVLGCGVYGGAGSSASAEVLVGLAPGRSGGGAGRADRSVRAAEPGAGGGSGGPGRRRDAGARLGAHGHLLRLPPGALEAPAHDQPGRVALRRRLSGFTSPRSPRHP